MNRTVYAQLNDTEFLHSNQLILSNQMDIMSVICVRLTNLIIHLVEPGNIKSCNKA